MSYYKDREGDDPLIDGSDEGPWLLEHVFRPRRREKYIILILAPLILGFFAIIWYSAFLSHPKSGWVLAVILLLIFAMLFIFAVIDVFRTRLIVDTERITIVRAFSTKYLPLDKIAGFRVDMAIVIESADPGMKNLRIPIFFEDIKLFAEWLHYNYQNLDTLEYATKEAVIRENSEYGFSEEQRLEHTNKIRKYTRILNITAVVTGGWLMVYPYPHQLLSVINMIIPLIALVMLAGGNGLIRINQKKNDPYPSVFWALCFPPIVLFIHAVLDTNIINYDNLWLPSAVISTILCLILAKAGSNEIRFKQKLYYFLIYSLIAGAVFVYSASSIVVVNTAFDSSQPQVIQAKVIKKSVHSGGHGATTYSVAVGKLLPQQQEDDMDITVSKRYYDGVSAGDMIDVYIQKGLFNLVWAKLEREYHFHSLFGLM